MIRNDSKLIGLSKGGAVFSHNEKAAGGWSECGWEEEVPFQTHLVCDVLASKRRRQTGKTRLEMETWESHGLRTGLHVGLGETDVSMQVRLLLTNDPP